MAPTRPSTSAGAALTLIEPPIIAPSLVRMRSPPPVLSHHDKRGDSSTPQTASAPEPRCLPFAIAVAIPPLARRDTRVIYPTVAASVEARPGATLAGRRSAPGLPSEMVLGCVAHEFAPSATELFDNACAPVPTATELF